MVNCSTRVTNGKPHDRRLRQREREQAAVYRWFIVGANPRDSKSRNEPEILNGGILIRLMGVQAAFLQGS